MQKINLFQLELPTEYSSDRLLLRRYRPSEAPAHYQMLRENWAHLYEFMPPKLVNAKNETDILAFIEWSIEEWQRRNLFILGFWDKSSAEYLGKFTWRTPIGKSLVSRLVISSSNTIVARDTPPKPPARRFASPSSTCRSTGWSCNVQRITKKARTWPNAAGSPSKAAFASATIKKMAH